MTVTESRPVVVDDVEQQLVDLREQAPALTLVVPTRNEGPNLRPLLERSTAALAPLGCRWELLFVDDSDDDTPQLVEQLIEQRDRQPAATSGGRTATVRLLHRPAGQRPDGLSGAVLAGFRAARGQVLAVMDADLQHPPEVLPELVGPLLRGEAEVAVASRYCAGSAPDAGAGLDGPWRRLVSRSARWPVFALQPRLRQVTDPLGGFFAVQREVLEGVTLAPTGFKILLEVLVRGRWDRVVEVPYRFAEREAGTSKASLRQGMHFARHLARLTRPADGEQALGAVSACDVDPRGREVLDRRPWGSFRRLSLNETTTVKVIEVDPGRRLSLQRHTRRGELWVVLDGPLHVHVDGVESLVPSGASVWVPRGSVHRAASPGPHTARFLEVAFGEFREEDIERLEDDFSRA
ncbi:MAG TPA: glycosyltransferase [Motilibacteraceae bacterium]|nr:glycosyltransferase [Motilibacteraceae bacterium]